MGLNTTGAFQPGDEELEVQNVINIIHCVISYDWDTQFLKLKILITIIIDEENVSISCLFNAFVQFISKITVLNIVVY